MQALFDGGRVQLAGKGLTGVLEEIVLVDLNGFEPLTSSMPWKRAPNCATGPLAWDVFADLLRRQDHNNTAVAFCQCLDVALR